MNKYIKALETYLMEEDLSHEVQLLDEYSSFEFICGGEVYLILTETDKEIFRNKLICEMANEVERDIQEAKDNLLYPYYVNPITLNMDAIVKDYNNSDIFGTLLDTVTVDNETISIYESN